MKLGSPRAARGLLCAMAVSSFVGCKATAYVGGDGGDDLAVPDGFAGDLAGADFAVTHDLRCSAIGAAEICGNGCDDDGNGYVDDDDPACTAQVLPAYATMQAGLARLVLDPAPRAVPFDGNSVQANAFPAYRRAFAPAVFLAVEGGAKELSRVAVPDGGMTNDFLSYPVRDVCVFNGELIVVQPGASSVLHRFAADGATELGTVPIASLFANSCTSDGNQLYVGVHDATNTNASQILVFDKTYTQVGAPIDLPATLVNDGYARLLDFAWTKKSGLFYGLFSTMLAPDVNLSADQIFPFSFDGSVGAPIDAGTLHGIGEFVP